MDKPTLDGMKIEIEARIAGIEEYLDSQQLNVKALQAHLELGSLESLYWHFGYMMALKDLMLRLDQCETRLRETIEKMEKDYVTAGSPGPLFNAGWAKACQAWAKRLKELVDGEVDAKT